MRHFLFSTLLFLQIILASESTLRQPQCLDYKVMQKVIENGWKASDTWTKKYIEDNATDYMKIFMQEVKKPIKIKTDEEYIKDSIKRYQTYIDDNIILSTSQTIQEYKKRLQKEVKHKIYYFRYANRLSTELFQVPYLYIKYLEDTNRIEEAFNIYKNIANHFSDMYQKQSYEMISIFTTIHNYELFTKALYSSLTQYSYTTKQKTELYTILSQFMLDREVFNKMIAREKNIIFEYLSIYYLEEKSADKIIKNEVILRKILNIIDEKNLKSHLENPSTRAKLVKRYKTHINKIYKKIKSFNTMIEYEAYDEKMRDIEHYLGTIEMLKLGSLLAMGELKLDYLNHFFKYKVKEEEFIHLFISLSLLTGKPWIYGKYKFELEEQYEKNKKLLELLK